MRRMGGSVTEEILGFCKAGHDTQDCEVVITPGPGCVTVTINTAIGEQFELILGAYAALRIGQDLVEGSQFDAEDGYRRRRKSMKLVEG